jgi:hypothetical protein
MHNYTPIKITFEEQAAKLITYILRAKPSQMDVKKRYLMVKYSKLER